MADLNQMELQHLRHLIGAHIFITSCRPTNKTTFYEISTRCIKYKAKINDIFK